MKQTVFEFEIDTSFLWNEISNKRSVTVSYSNKHFHMRDSDDS